MNTWREKCQSHSYFEIYKALKGQAVSSLSVGVFQMLKDLEYTILLIKLSWLLYVVIDGWVQIEQLEEVQVKEKHLFVAVTTFGVIC